MKALWLAATMAIVPTVSAAETYALVHAVGDTENVSAKGLTKAECEKRKADLKVVATALGTYNEATGHGSITCLPDSLLNGGQ